jgi:perosamine synthetase
MEFINYMEPSYDSHEIAAVTKYINTGAWLTEFKETRNFEDGIGKYVNSPYVSVMANGTVTLMAALMAIGIKPGDEVIVPDFTMAATAHAVSVFGAKPVFVDVERETLCMDFERMKEAVTHNTKAVIFVDLNGRYASRFMEIISFCKENALWLIEDAAQALGSFYQGKALGTFGNMGSYSFSMPKIITTGQGGAIVTASKELYDRLLQIRDFGREKAGEDHYMMVGLNFKFTDLQAVVGIEQMRKMPERVMHKKEICKKYDARLKDMAGVEIFRNNYEDTVPCFYELLCERRDELISYLKTKNIGARKFYPPLHSEPAYKVDKSFPVTEEISAKGLWLPSSVLLDEEKVDYICNCIAEFME